ncbi:hypothetical protein PMSM_23525 [Paenibacillus macquariensis subsp. macquariensis]|uniref:Uncharacterized protein n=1 Tax=Paenibacillus macquariensis TaxID=948756 RepID=A0ABY1KE03_9BACL|nr:hypothetical protein PMSM_23525 [Paenibacillus macquariensis subsp. macquariensis]SIR68601.1 hypothetical protein SAMN05421578_13318 [Paenibacillus macquariensis]
MALERSILRKNKIEDKSVDKISSNLEYANFDSKEEFIEVTQGTMNKFSFYVKHKKLYKLINGSDKSLSEINFKYYLDFI